MKPVNPAFITAFASLTMLCAFVEPTRAQTGSSAYEFLEIPTSSRVYGLGGCNVSAIDTEVTLSQQNPALLGAEIESQLGVSYMHYMGSANFAGARFGHSSGERGAWAAGIRYLNYGEISGYDNTGAYTGSFTPVDMCFDGTYSHDFTDRLRGGISLKMVYSNYEQYTAFALAADLGINYFDPNHDLSVGLVLKNMGGQLKRFEDNYDHLPFDVQLGLTKGLGESFSISVTAWNLTKWKLPYYKHSDS
ncbi:MAG: type IX secretion system protein PorQ, partial [Muribaculaceae bacterium]|nr:type IX secretion system protein PorQ [Muribaculaceae bacterium]